MPIDLSCIAKTSAFQNNCLLNTLVHTICNNYGSISDSGKKSLLEYFRIYYGITTLDAAELENILNGLRRNPIHREVVLGPVLRGMLGNPRAREPGVELETDRHFLELANGFGVRVECYTHLEPTLDQLVSTATAQEGRIRDSGVGRPIPLKLCHNGSNHWQFEAGAAHDHNRHYDNRYPYRQEDTDALRGRIASAIRARNFDLSQMLKTYEEGQATPSISNPLTQLFGGMFGSGGTGGQATDTVGGLGGLANMLGSIFGQNSLIGKLFNIVIPALTSLFAVFKKLSREVNPQQKLLDEELTAEGIMFNRCVDMLPEGMQGSFYLQWRKKPNTPEIWLDLMRRLQQEGNLEEADALLKFCEQAAFKTLEVEDTGLRTDSHVFYKETLSGFTEADGRAGVGLEDLRLNAAGEDYKNQNFAVRLQCLKEYYACQSRLANLNQQLAVMPRSHDSATVSGGFTRINTEKTRNLEGFKGAITRLYDAHVNKCREALREVEMRQAHLKKEKEEKEAKIKEIREGIGALRKQQSDLRAAVGRGDPGSVEVIEAQNARLQALRHRFQMFSEELAELEGRAMPVPVATRMGKEASEMEVLRSSGGGTSRRAPV